VWRLVYLWALFASLREQRAIAASLPSLLRKPRSAIPEQPLCWSKLPEFAPRQPGLASAKLGAFDRHQARRAYFIAESLRRNGLIRAVGAIFAGSFSPPVLAAERCGFELTPIAASPAHP